MAVQLKKGQVLHSLKIKRLGINGEGIANYKGKTLFVDGVLPSEVCDVLIERIEKNYAKAKVLKIKKESPSRVQPFCPIVNKCGGCQLQHLSYEAQLEFKKDLLVQALKKFKLAGYENYKIEETIGMQEPTHYRNKAQFQLGTQKGNVIAGLYAMNSHQLVDLKECPIQDERTIAVIRTVRELFQKYKMPIYMERKRTGDFKRLMTRVGVETGEVQLVFVTRSLEFPNKEKILRELKELHPEVVSIMQNIQPKNSSEIFGEKTILLDGKSSIEETMDNLRFDLSARAFFQLNPKQTKVLYHEARKALSIDSEDVVVDAYCGVGTIGLSLAPYCKEVRGMDIIPQAIQDAKKNAQRLGVENTHYEAGSAEELIPRWIAKGFRPTAIVVDPPRTGLDKKLIQTILEAAPQKMVYISCNVSTLARDLVELTKKYNVDFMKSVDMFPHTSRCEVVVKLVKK